MSRSLDTLRPFVCLFDLLIVWALEIAKRGFEIRNRLLSSSLEQFRPGADSRGTRAPFHAPIGRQRREVFCHDDLAFLLQNSDIAQFSYIGQSTVVLIVGALLDLERRLDSATALQTKHELVLVALT